MSGSSSPHGSPQEGSDQPAGAFALWLGETRRAIRGEVDANVPCDGCTACCRSSQFVHVGPDEYEALERIPNELLFAAPLLPDGHMLLGYDERGHCPMLVDDRCSIYASRPKTCRTYDCRVFPATGVELGDDKELIARRADRWRFEHPTVNDRRQHDAAIAAANYLSDNGDRLADGSMRSGPTQRAVLAVQISDRFVARDFQGDG